MKQSLFGVSHLACHPCPAGKRAHTHAPPRLHSRLLGRGIGRGTPTPTTPPYTHPLRRCGRTGAPPKGRGGGQPPPSLAGRSAVPSCSARGPRLGPGTPRGPQAPATSSRAVRGSACPPTPCPRTSTLRPGPRGRLRGAVRGSGGPRRAGDPVPTRRPVPPRGLAAPAGPISPTPPSVCFPPFAGRCAWLCYYGI